MALVVDDQYGRQTNIRLRKQRGCWEPEDGDNEAKVIQTWRQFAADFVTLASNRVYGVVPRQLERHPTRQFYEMLFDGSHYDSRM